MNSFGQITNTANRINRCGSFEIKSQVKTLLNVCFQRIENLSSYDTKKKLIKHIFFFNSFFTLKPN